MENQTKRNQFNPIQSSQRRRRRRRILFVVASTKAFEAMAAAAATNINSNDDDVDDGFSKNCVALLYSAQKTSCSIHTRWLDGWMTGSLARFLPAVLPAWLT